MTHWKDLNSREFQQQITLLYFTYCMSNVVAFWGTENLPVRQLQLDPSAFLIKTFKLLDPVFFTSCMCFSERENVNKSFGSSTGRLCSVDIYCRPRIQLLFMWTPLELLWIPCCWVFWEGHFEGSGLLWELGFVLMDRLAIKTVSFLVTYLCISHFNTDTKNTWTLWILLIYDGWRIILILSDICTDGLKIISPFR